MKAKRFPIEGNLPAVVSPFDGAGDLMIDDFAEIVRWNLDAGADGICVAGDNGEAWALTAEDRKRLAETAVEVVAGRVPVLMGTSATTARQTIAYAEIAAAAGVDALMIGPQSYVLKATTREIVDRFTAIHKAVPLPVVLYNSPRRTGLNLDVDVLAALCDAVPVIGLKESSRDFFHTTEVIRRFADRLCVCMGPAPHIFPGLALGAGGFISSGPELMGGVARRFRTLAAGKPNAESRTLHFAVTRIYQTLMATGTWPAALKAALNMIGVPAGVPREPVQPLTPKQADGLRAIMDELGLLPRARAAGRAGAAE